MKIKQLKIINQDESTEVADIGADAANIDYNDTNVKLKLDELSNDNNRSKSNITNLQTELDTTNSNLDLQTSRIDNLAHLDEGSTTGDAELIDARVGIQGLKGSSLGEHIRNLEDVLLSIGTLKKLVDIANISEETYIRWADGKRIGFSYKYYHQYLSSTSNIEVSGLTKLYIFGMPRALSQDAKGLAFLTKTGAYLSGVQYQTTDFSQGYEVFDVPQDACYVRITINGSAEEAANMMINVNGSMFSDVLQSYKAISSLNMWNTITKNATSLDEVRQSGIYIFPDTDFLTNAGITGFPTMWNPGYNLNTEVKGNVLLVYGAKQNEGGKIQLLISPSFNTGTGEILKPHLYIRLCWSYSGQLQWGNWISLNDNPLATNLALTSEEQWNNYGNDINNFIHQGLYVCAWDNSAKNIQNLPEKTHGSLLVLRPEIENAKSLGGLLGGLQLYHTVDGHWYSRTIWSSKTDEDHFTEWQRLNPNIPTIPEVIHNKELFKIFKTVGCIGDSLASGEVYYKKDDGTYGGRDMYEYSWGQYMAKMSGNTYYNFSSGGLSTRTWLTAAKGAPLAFDGNHKCTCYIIGLAQNDKGKLGPSYIGTIDDIHDDDYTQNADTFYGNYGRIIEMCKNEVPKCKIFILTDPLYDDTEVFNVAIKNIANHYNGKNVYLINLAGEDYDTYHNTDGFIQSQKRHGHYSAAGYKYMADILATKISNYIETHPTEFREVEFIDTEYHYYE